MENVRSSTGFDQLLIQACTYRSLQEVGATHGESVIPPPTRTEPYPPLPREVDDIYIYPTHIEQQPPGAIPQLTGFNANVRVFLSLDPLEEMEIAYGFDKEPNWDAQKRVLNHCLGLCKQVLHGMPSELTVWQSTNHSVPPGQNFYASMHEYLGFRNLPALNAFDTESPPEERRRVQFEIQKANIYASQLCTRSYIVEKYFTLHEAHRRVKARRSEQTSPGVGAVGLDVLLQQAVPTADDGVTEQEMSAERESIIKDLLVMLGSISQVHMEPSAESFVSRANKIRCIFEQVADANADCQDQTGCFDIAGPAKRSEGLRSAASGAVSSAIPRYPRQARAPHSGKRRLRAAGG